MGKYAEIFSRKVVAWYLYDWACSSFSSVIVTFIFATYFTEKVAFNNIVGTAQWGTAMSIAGLCIAILSPIFGAITDHEGRRKPWLALFSVLLVCGCAALWFVKPQTEYVTLALFCVVIADIGFEVGMVFYNSMLSELVPYRYLGRASGWGWGAGYIGGLVALSTCLYFFINGHFTLFYLDKTTAEQIRIIGPFVALWLTVFSIPLFVFTPDRPSSGLGIYKSVRAGLSQLRNTLQILRQHKMVARFLLARMIYIDGLNTVFAFGGIYAAGTFHFTFQDVVLFGIGMNIAAGLGSFGFAWLDDLIGSKFIVLCSLLIILVCATFIVIIHSTVLFWVFGMLLSMCVGPVQSASRTLLIRLTPNEILTQMFGLYALSGKATAFIGPWVLGWVTYYFSSQRVGVSTILIFFVLGFLVLLSVKYKQNDNS